MVKFIAAKCPSCRADLDIDNDTKKYNCPYCGTLVLIEKDTVKESPVINENKRQSNDSSDVNYRKDIISDAKKLINKKQYQEAKDMLYEIVDDKDIEGRTLIALACCKEIESDPLFKDACLELGSYELKELLNILEELKTLDKNKNYLKVLSEFENNFSEYKKIYNHKMEYKNLYDKTNRMLNELYLLASKKLSIDTALQMIKDEFGLEGNKLLFLPFDKLQDLYTLMNSRYDEFKLDIDKGEKAVEINNKKNELKNIGIILGIVLIGIILFFINPWIIYFVGMLGMFFYLALVK